MKNLINTVIVLISCYYAYSQEIQTNCKIVYDFNISLDGTPKNYKSTLFSNQKQSIFFWNDQMSEKNTEESGELGNVSIKVNINDSIGTINKTDFEKDSLFTRTVWIKGETYIIKEKKPKLNWTLHEQQKYIGDLLSTKATCEFRGRSYTAWYATSIPIPFGPWKLHGLPGVILEARDSKGEVEFLVESINIPHSQNIQDLSRSGKTISLKNYVEKRGKLVNSIVKSIKGKLPRGATVEVNETEVNHLEFFPNK
ncbi:GLPGLI family protein [Aquimarina sp. ERC-38]|uniref:GLPGLI family protein n=1 Tax=Aquimarina sp. ERC-38 TaxID=2949996 RepID=UPI002245DDE4|nr:GLPGLI family protein [Aquimarina sp. ERC-38]UZO81704.1 GLPGLI family protein [Aquimarina sp. ERC-38]